MNEETINEQPPIPKLWKTLKGLTEIIRRMKVGDSILIPNKISSNTHAYCVSIGCVVTTRKVDDEYSRLWRVDKHYRDALHILTIDKDVPMPKPKQIYGKLEFLRQLQIGDSFVFDGNLHQSTQLWYQPAKRIGIILTFRTETATTTRIWRTEKKENEVNMSQYIVEDDIPMPEKKFKDIGWWETIEKMEVGQSFVCELKKQSRIAFVNKRLKKLFHSRKINDTEIRIWRLE